MREERPIDLAARRRVNKRAARVATLQRWLPSRAALAWTALAGAVVAGYFVLGKGETFKQADLGAVHAGGIGECGYFRRTCLVDGDTGWQDGIKWRMLNIDAPEMDDKAECANERAMARASLERLMALMADGYSVRSSGRYDKFNRLLVDVVLADGRDAGRALMQEGFAQPWPNRGNVWCGR